MNDYINVQWSGGSRELHPSFNKFHFKDKNGVEYRSVKEAFIKFTLTMSLNISQSISLLVMLFKTQVSQNKELKGILMSTIGKLFIFNDKDPSWLPLGNDTIWGITDGMGLNLYGIKVLGEVRDALVNAVSMAKFTVSRGTVPNGSQPCKKCGGEDRVAGTGYYAHQGGFAACFDCLPYNDRSGRGQGFINRSQARRNMNYCNRKPEKFDINNIWDPDDAALWTIPVVCMDCGQKKGMGIMLHVGKETRCHPCYIKYTITDRKVILPEVKTTEMPI